MNNPKINLIYAGNDPVVKKMFAHSPFFRFRSHNNAYHVFQAMEKELPDVLLCEYHLKGIRGDSLVRQINASNYSAKLAIIMLYETSKPVIKKELLEMKVWDAYKKPVSFDRIYARSVLWTQTRDQKKSTVAKTNTKIPLYKTPLPKRLFDIAFAGLALLFLMPLFLLVAIAIRIESRGPVFYASKRIGSGFKSFSFYKFRSMYANADKQVASLKVKNLYAQADTTEKEPKHKCSKCEELGHSCSSILIMEGKEICENLYLKHKKSISQGTFFKVKDDPRITRIGKFIRNSSIDELPQLFNVLKGDMSIVGNRPLPPYEAEMLTNDLWAERFLGPAGITGLWQVKNRGKSSASEMERKSYDNVYARSNSFFNDLWIIIQTIPAVFQKENV